uniref:LIM and SH3 domain protein 1 n=1 Tax=Xiphophorus couchianus TaxID=32473 RepID=A0A3B5MI33_9TELE
MRIVPKSRFRCRSEPGFLNLVSRLRPDLLLYMIREKMNCELESYWHKGCFSCEICKMTLNMKNYKGFDKRPYCNAHYPKTNFTCVADTPENLRLKQQTKMQSQVRPRLGASK